MSNINVPISNFTPVEEEIANGIIEIIKRYTLSFVDYNVEFEIDENKQKWFIIEVHVDHNLYVGELLVEGSIEDAVREQFSNSIINNIKGKVVYV